MTRRAASTTDDGAEPDLRPEQLSAGHAPRPRPSAVTRRLGEEVLVVDASNGRLHLLNTSAALVWECLDGSAALGELASELADAFGVAVAAMEADVVSIARDFGERGLLERVSPERRAPAELPRIDAGAQIGGFAVTDALGEPALLPRPGRSTLLVNWSPYCGYCSLIAPTLEELRAPLAARGVELALLTNGSREDNARMLPAPGLADVLYYRATPAPVSNGAAGRDPFGFAGTPVAYLVDEAGTVVAPLATGATEVPNLARGAAGLPSEQVPSNGLAAASATCGPRPAGGAARPARVWARTSAYRLGEVEVGVRADSEQTDQLLAALLAAYRLEDATDANGAPAPGAPANFSVVLSEAAGAADGATSATSARSGPKALSLLLVGDRTALRSRSPRRVVEALVARLSEVATPPPPELIGTSNVAVVRDGRAVLLPGGAWRHIERLQGPLFRIGLALSDAPVLVDPVTAELVVPEPRLSLDPSVLERLGEAAPARGELASPPPGRYPVELWLLDEGAPGRPAGAAPTAAARVAGAMPSVNATPETVGAVVDALELAFRSIPTALVALEPLDDFIAWLRVLAAAA